MTVTFFLEPTDAGRLEDALVRHLLSRPLVRIPVRSAWTWPAVALVAILVAGIAFLFGAAPDQPTRDQILGYFETLITFIIGTLTGAIGASAVAYFNGRTSGLEDAKRL